MRISAIQTYNPQIKNYKTKKQQRPNETRPNNQITFGSFSLVSSSFLLGKTISETIKCNTMRKNIKLVSTAFDAPKEHLKDLAEAVQLLSKMKERFNWVEAVGKATNFMEERPEVDEMQNKALKEIFPLMDDNNGKNRVAKITLMETIYNSGNSLNEDYIKAFEALPDNLYKGFKQTLVEKAINTFDVHGSGNECLYGLRLLKSIEKDEYKDYLKNIIPEYKNLLTAIDCFALKNLTKEHNDAYETYSNNFLYKGEWKEHYQKIFYSIVGALGNDIPKLAKKLNIDEVCAKDIINDLQARSAAEKAREPEEKIKILSKRLEEKFANGLVKKPKRADDYGDRYYALSLYETNIDSFINKTEFAKEFKEFYKPELDKIREDCREARDAEIYETESREEDIIRIMHML